MMVRLLTIKFLTIGVSFSLLFSVNLTSDDAFAQSLLPVGIGFYQLGFRSYTEQDSKYSASGEKVGLGNQFNRSLTGKNLLQGKGGTELKQLADELANYGQDNGSANLLERLDLGTVKGDVKADIQARYIGLGYGLNKRWTIFMAVPWIDASVKTSLSFTGNNNADEIQGQLGDLAFSDLAAGLARADQLNATDIKNNIEAEGYASIDEWKHSGFGDLKLGTRTAMSQRLARQMAADLGLTVALDLPTGYTEDADVLTDFDFGRGYYSLVFSSVQRLTLMRSYSTGLETTYAKNFNTTVEKRVPEADEGVVAADRKSRVRMNPGDETDVAWFAGAASGWIGSAYRVGAKRHFSDTYSGSLDGKYERLGEGSSKYQAYQELVLSLTSVDAYRKKAFSVPFILDFKAHHTLEGRDANDERFYELSLASFFDASRRRVVK